MRNLSRNTRHVLTLFAIGMVLFGAVLASTKTVHAAGVGLTNLVLAFNNNARDVNFGPVDFMVSDAATGRVVVSRRPFLWGKLNPPGGVDRWHREVSLEAGRAYVITVFRGNRQGSRNFRAATGRSITFFARDLRIWP